MLLVTDSRVLPLSILLSSLEICLDIKDIIVGSKNKYVNDIPQRHRALCRCHFLVETSASLTEEKCDKLLMFHLNAFLLPCLYLLKV